MFNETVVEKIKKFVGTGYFKVTAFNPTPEWVEENAYVSTVGRYDENFELFGTDDDGNKFFVPVVAVESVDNKAGGNGIKLLISIGNPFVKGRVVNVEQKAKSGNIQYKDKDLNFSYPNAELGDFSEKQKKFFDVASKVPSLVGEEQFYTFWKTFTGDTNSVDIESFFKGGFTKFGKSVLEYKLSTGKSVIDSPINRIGILVGINDKGYYNIHTKMYLSRNSQSTKISQREILGDYGFKGSEGTTVWHEFTDTYAEATPDVEAPEVEATETPDMPF